MDDFSLSKRLVYSTGQRRKQKPSNVIARRVVDAGPEDYLKLVATALSAKQKAIKLIKSN